MKSLHCLLGCVLLLVALVVGVSPTQSQDKPQPLTERALLYRTVGILSAGQVYQAYLNIGMLGGAEVVNAKAADAWFTVDLRSTNQEVITDLEKQIAAILKEEADRVNMTVKTERISTTPVSTIAGNRESELVKIAEMARRVAGVAPIDLADPATRSVRRVRVVGSLTDNQLGECHALGAEIDLVQPVARFGVAREAPVRAPRPDDVRVALQPAEHPVPVGEILAECVAHRLRVAGA